MSFGPSGQRAAGSGQWVGCEWAGPPASGNSMTLPMAARTKRLNRPTLACLWPVCWCWVLATCQAIASRGSITNRMHGVDDADPKHQLGDTAAPLLHVIHGLYNLFEDSEREKITKHASRQAPPSPCPRNGPRSRSGAEARGRVAPKSVRLGRYRSQFLKMAPPRGARRRQGAPDPRSLLDRGPDHLLRAAER